MSEAAGLVEPAAAASWWALDADGQHIGPYTTAQLAEYVAQGQMLEEALVWAEGQPDWRPIKDVTSIQSTAAFLAANEAAAYTIVAKAGDASQATAKGTAIRAAATPIAAQQQGQDAEFAAFQAELADIDPDAAAALDPGARSTGAQAAEGVSTPPPDEQRFVDDDGTVYLWDGQLRKFVEEGSTAATAPEYNPDDMTYEPEEEKIPAVPRPAEEEQEGQEGAAPGAEHQTSATAAPPAAPPADAAAAKAASTGKSGKSAADVMAKHAERQKRALEADKPKEWFELKVNTSVYVTALPDDVTEAEFAEVFTKCGVIKEGDDHKPRVKLYQDKSLNVFKGDGLVTYLKEPSVELACRILDGAQFRPGQGQPMTVQPAKFEMHGEAYKPRKKSANKRQKKAAASAEEKALGWGGFDDQLKATEVTVILLHMFQPAELQEDASYEKDLEADVKTECGKVGPVDKVRIFVNNPQGAVMVRFKVPDAAQQCIQKMKGRFFGGQQLDALMWDGVTNYMVKKQKQIVESPEEEAARLEQFAEEIEQS